MSSTFFAFAKKVLEGNLWSHYSGLWPTSTQ